MWLCLLALFFVSIFIASNWKGWLEWYAASEKDWNRLLLDGLTVGKGDISPEEFYAVIKKRIERTLIRTVRCTHLDTLKCFLLLLCDIYIFAVGGRFLPAAHPDWVSERHSVKNRGDCWSSSGTTTMTSHSQTSFSSTARLKWCM